MGRGDRKTLCNKMLQHQREDREGLVTARPLPPSSSLAAFSTVFMKKIKTKSIVSPSPLWCLGVESLQAPNPPALLPTHLPPAAEALPGGAVRVAGDATPRCTGTRDQVRLHQ